MHLCVPVYQLNCNCINSSVLPTTLLSPSMVSLDSPLFHLVRRPEPTVDQFWEKLRLVATVEIALPSRRPEKGHLCIFLTRMWWLFFFIYGHIHDHMIILLAIYDHISNIHPAVNEALDPVILLACLKGDKIHAALPEHNDHDDYHC